jgi:hypothetical protein
VEDARRLVAALRTAVAASDPALEVRQEPSQSGADDDCICIYDGDRKVRRVWDGETPEEIVVWLRTHRTVPRSHEEIAAENREERRRERERLAEQVKQASPLGGPISDEAWAQRRARSLFRNRGRIVRRLDVGLLIRARGASRERRPAHRITRSHAVRGRAPDDPHEPGDIARGATR